MTPAKLEQARKELALTQKEMAKAMNVDLSTYTRWIKETEFTPRISDNIKLRLMRAKGRLK